MNGVIADLEVYEAIQNLKNNKAPGTDKILNEYLKHSPSFLVKMYCKLFNIVLNTGIIPENWTCGVIKPIFKNKGCPTDPDNFLAITLIRERPFNLKGAGVMFFSKKNILIPNVAEKNILILVEEKKNNLIQSFCHIT